jgi:hypothetical protein
VHALAFDEANGGFEVFVDVVIADAFLVGVLHAARRRRLSLGSASVQCEAVPAAPPTGVARRPTCPD